MDQGEDGLEFRFREGEVAVEMVLGAGFGFHAEEGEEAGDLFEIAPGERQFRFEVEEVDQFKVMFFAVPVGHSRGEDKEVAAAEGEILGSVLITALAADDDGQFGKFVAMGLGQGIAAGDGHDADRAGGSGVVTDGGAGEDIAGVRDFHNDRKVHFSGRKVKVFCQNWRYFNKKGG